MNNFSIVGERGKAERRTAIQRTEQLESDIFDLVESGAAIREIFDALMRAMRQKISVRGEDATKEKGWSYQWIDDGAVQITAARTLAGIIGLQPKPGGINVAINDNSIRITVDQQMAEIASIGIAPGEILAELRGVVERATPVLEVKPGKTEPAPSVEAKAEIVDFGE